MMNFKIALNELNTVSKENEKSSRLQQERDFIAAVIEAIGCEAVRLNSSDISKACTNTLGINRKAMAILIPKSVQDLEKIVANANLYSVSLHPISRGQNIGYGEKTPYQEGHVIVDLSSLDRVVEYNDVFGEIEIEPGVTQQQLYEYLKLNGDQYIADMTGAPTNSSVVGNYLEGGFGHTPIGNRRQNILDLEVILGSGQKMKTGQFPGLGPNIAALFVQSNFGIVTKMRIPLMRKPENVVTFTLDFKTQSELIKGIDVLRELRQKGHLTSLLHIGNATRLFMTRYRFPENLDPSIVLQDEDCQLLMNNSIMKHGTWSAVGAIYGSSEQVTLTQRHICKSLANIAKVKFFTDSSLPRLKKMVRILFSPLKNLKESLLKGIATLESIHELTKGIPTDLPMKNIFWRVNDQEKLGLIWFCPLIRAEGKAVEELLTMVRPIFKKYCFEMPLTMTLVDHRKLICVFNISFDKSQESECKRAWEAHGELSQAIKELGGTVYRMGLLDKSSLYVEQNKWSVLSDIKQALDPNKIISPGRYGIK